MRKELKFMVCANVLALIGILYLTFDLLTLAIDDTFQDALLDVDLNPPPGTPEKPQLIPKIIHQTYKTSEIPEHWKEGRQKCIDLHPDYEYILWTDEMSDRFIKEEYPWFLDTFRNYKYPIERADAIRYFVLSHFGGVYIDLDDGCERKLDRLLTVPAFARKTSPTGISNDVMGSVPRHPFFLKLMHSLKKYDGNFVLSHFGGVYIDLDDGCERKLDRLLTVPAFARKTSPTGISNDVMGSVPRHPFFLKLMHSLKKYDGNWLIPYVTIMASTGPLFVSMIWKQYKRWGVPENGVVRILQPADYKMHTYSFFSISRGSSWHMDDAKFVKGLGSHILACVVAGFVLAFFVLYLEYCLYCWLCSAAVGKRLQHWVNWIRRRSYDEESARQKRLRKDSNLPFVLVPEVEKGLSLASSE
ncbi:related to Mannosyl phosphorylinositol ceramide synthase SUR1 [Zygosaccharomyces bailii ISA1307]|nr:related to Mannosyl phosphorylinositol ceramide synthase SUR1 [Zygosaccharomyces bailii ISA1307]